MSAAKKETPKPESEEFPKYLMKVGGDRKFVTFREAYVLYDSGLVRVDFGRYVLEKDFSVRPMTDKDKAKISEAADEYSASK